MTIKEAKDFVGKKVGAPGIGAFLQVLFRKWLIEKGVDPESVNFVEVTFPTMSDALKSGVGRRRAHRRTLRHAHDRGRHRRCRGALCERPRRAPTRSSPMSRRATSPTANPGGDQGLPGRDRGGRRRSSTPTATRRARRSPSSPSSRSRSSSSTGRTSLTPELKPADFAWWIDTMKQQNMLQTDDRSQPRSSCRDRRARRERGDLRRERAAARVEADIVSGALAPGSRLGIAEMAARVTASARRRCARPCRASSRAGSSTRSASAAFASRAFRATTSPTSCGPHADRARGAAAQHGARRRRLGGARSSPRCIGCAAT